MRHAGASCPLLPTVIMFPAWCARSSANATPTGDERGSRFIPTNDSRVNYVALEMKRGLGGR
ncbi:hypothetical protein T484DRAFT_1934008 [Baffinella frigidus]|nr:hypothetical protein T484DRAFT_1934008 [Cryptophyta sp. CCMP2293]